MATDTIAAYAEELSHLDPARLELAFKAIIQKGEFWPSIARILEAERNLVFGNEDARRFRALELALIELNDRRKGGLTGGDAYQVAYHKLLSASGFSEEQLSQAPVYAQDKSGANPDPNLTWDALEWRRRAYLPQEPPERKQVPGVARMPSQTVESIRQALAGSLNTKPKEKRS